MATVGPTSLQVTPVSSKPSTASNFSVEVQKKLLFSAGISLDEKFESINEKESSFFKIEKFPNGSENLRGSNGACANGSCH